MWFSYLWKFHYNCINKNFVLIDVINVLQKCCSLFLYVSFGCSLSIKCFKYVQNNKHMWSFGIGGIGYVMSKDCCKCLYMKVKNRKSIFLKTFAKIIVIMRKIILLICILMLFKYILLHNIIRANTLSSS